MTNLNVDLSNGQQTVSSTKNASNNNEYSQVDNLSPTKETLSSKCKAFKILHVILGLLLFLVILLKISSWLVSPFNDELTIEVGSVNINDDLELSVLRLREPAYASLSYELDYKPEQLHLSLGANSSELIIVWSTMRQAVESKLVFGKINPITGHLSEKQTILANIDEWEVSDSDPVWMNVVKQKKRVLYTYSARMSPLEDGSLYAYHVTATSPYQTTYSSRTYQFVARNLSDPWATIRMALYGDLGLINGQSIPQLIRDVDKSEYDAIIHNGDFAYDLDTHHGQYGDEFMRKIEPIAARVPYQVSVGNHEFRENFTHYDRRFIMVNSGDLNRGDRNNFFYSFDLGPIHFIAFSTEFYYFLEDVGISALSRQYAWLEEDLTFANSPAQRKLRPWIVVFGHRPMYCSSRSRDDCSKETNILRKGLPFTGLYALEKLFYDYAVDVELYSHEHQYERFLPIYDGVVYNGTDRDGDPYFNPKAPVHIISGSAGCQERLDPYIDHPRTGSVMRISDYGFTRLYASRCKLEFKQISDDQDGVVVDQFSITKTTQNFPTKGEKLICSTEETDSLDLKS